MKFKKTFRDLKYRVLKPKIFIILFGLFFLFNTNLSIAEIVFTQEVAARPDHVEPSYTNLGGTASNSDALERPQGGTFNHNGTLVFFLNNRIDHTDQVTVMSLSTPYDLRTASRVFEGGDPIIDIAGGTLNSRITLDIDFNNDGTKLFLTALTGEVFPFDLQIPYSFAFNSGMSFTADSEVDLGARGELEFNNDGTKMYFVHGQDNPTLDEYTLTTAFDISSRTLVNTQSLSAKINPSLTNKQVVTGFAFNDTGASMYVLIRDEKNNNDTIFQYQLRIAFDTSTAVFIGKADLDFGLKVGTFFNHIGTVGHVFNGLIFSGDGSKMYIINDSGQDHAHQLSLSCNFGVAACVTDTASNIGSQVELASKNIHYNTSNIFKRFEWLRRNKDSQNLSNHNIKFNIYNPILTSLVKKKQTSLKKNKSSTVKTNWSYWSHGDISFSDQVSTYQIKPKEIKISGLMFGADRKFGVNNLFGAAIRYGKDNAKILSSNQSMDAKSLTLNFYGTIAQSESTYTNALIGVSVLRIDQKFNDKLTGERNGKQAFAALNFRSKNNFGILKLDPSAKISYGVTSLSDYTDFLSNVTTGVNEIYESQMFETGNAAIGFLFHMEPFEIDTGTMRPHGGIEYVHDISPTTTFFHSNSSGAQSTKIGKYSSKNFKGNFGLESIFNNGFTFSINYERFQHLDKDISGRTDSFLFKIGRIDGEDSEFALIYNPIQNDQTELSYAKNLNGFDIKINSNYSFTSKIPDYGASIEVSNTF